MPKGKQKLTQANFDAIRDHLFDRIHTTGELVKNDFPNILRTAIETKSWEHFTDAVGKPFKNLVEWLHYTYPNGTSMGEGKHAISYEEALKLTEVASDVHRALERNKPKLKAVRARQKVASEASPRRGAKRRRTLLTRLEEEEPDFHRAYLRGQYSSVTAAAKASGLVKPNRNQNLVRAKSAFRKMTPAQRAEFLEWSKAQGRG